MLFRVAPGSEAPKPSWVRDGAVKLLHRSHIHRFLEGFGGWNYVDEDTNPVDGGLFARSNPGDSELEESSAQLIIDDFDILISRPSIRTDV